MTRRRGSRSPTAYWDLPSRIRTPRCVANIGAEALPFDWTMPYWLGMAHLALGQHGSALEALRRACSLNADLDVRKHEAGLLSALGRHAEAFDIARQQSKAKLETDATAQCNLGWDAYLVGEFDESIAAPQRALTLDPDPINAAFTLGDAQRRMGR